MLTLANETLCMTHNDKFDPIISTLENGGTILYPTDTVWGIGCDAENAEAVEKIYELKQSDRSKPFVLLVSSVEMLKKYVRHVHPRIETLLIYHTQPLTMIYDEASNLPEICTGQGGSVAIRIPNDPFCKELIEKFGHPLVAASANISNDPFPAHFGEISSAVICGVDHVVKYRQTDKMMKSPSVIAKLSDPVKAELVFLRE